VKAGESTILVGAQQRMLAEGARILDIKAPGIVPVYAAALGAAIVARLGGETLVEMPIAPWLDLQVGDPVIITAAHPLLYDWDNGAWSVASLSARVVGWRHDLRTGATRIRFLAASGDGRDALSLCPTATILGKNSTTDFDLNAGEGVHFAAGDSIQFYTPGDEASEKQTRVIDTITVDNITLTVAASAWVGVDTEVTYPAHGSATSDQADGFLYVQSTKHWDP
jgi:hypothetical protein